MILRGLLIGAVTSATLALSGCASRFGERHYFKSDDGNGGAVNYYRVSVRGGTFLSNSRYLSGYFDESAVDAYFSQTSTGKGFRAPEKASLQSIDPALQDRKLVLVLSANADTVAGEIGQFADNAALMDSLTTLISRGGPAGSAQKLLQREQERARSVIAAGQQLTRNLPATPTATDAQKRALELANRLAAELGRQQPFTSLQQARGWLNANRARLLAEEAP